MDLNNQLSDTTDNTLILIVEKLTIMKSAKDMGYDILLKSKFNYTPQQAVEWLKGYQQLPHDLKTFYSLPEFLILMDLPNDLSIEEAIEWMESKIDDDN